MTQIETRPVDDLEPHPKNEEVYGEKQLGMNFLDSIAQEGIRDPLVIKPDGTIVSGHRRWRGATEVGLDEVPVIVRDFESKPAEWKAIIDHNRHRDKTRGQVLREGELLEEAERVAARERMSEGGKKGGESEEKGTENLPDPSKGETREKVGEKLGISGRTYEKGKRVKEAAEDGTWAGDPVDDDVQAKAQEEYEKLDEDEQTYHGAYESVKEASEDEDDGESRALDEVEDGPPRHTCAVCGEEWIEFQETLNTREGERVAVDHVCILDWPDRVILHVEEEEFA